VSYLTVSGMVHGVDWFPTIVEGVNGDPSTITQLDGVSSQLDGVSMWTTLMQQTKNLPRSEFVYNFDDKAER
jgi:arylsulfatase A-like enzyme